MVIGFDLKNNKCYVDRTKSGKHEFSKVFSAIHQSDYVFGKQIIVKALIDAASIELFVDDGKLAMTEIFFPNTDFDKLTLFQKGGGATNVKSELIPIQTIWTK